MAFSVEERAALMDALQAAYSSGLVDVVTSLEALALARRRAQQRRDSDAVTDLGRRLTVSTRLPRALAEKYRACAHSHGLSLYRFVCNALEREYAKLTKSNKCASLEVISDR